MIVKSRVMARLEVDNSVLAYTDEQGVLNAIGGRLESAVIGEGENIGAWIRKGSVWVDKGGAGKQPFTTAYYGEWCPDPTQGCEFRGGPYDGEIKPMQRERDGKPAGFIVLPEPVFDFSLSAAFEPDFPPAPMPQPPRYRREGIDSMQDRWVYVLD